MASLSISAAWEEGARIAAREFRLLFPIAFLLSVVPSLLVTTLMPTEQSVEMMQFVQFVQRNGIGSIILIAILVGIVVMAISTLGNMTISYLALRPGTSVGEGFGVAIRRLPSVLGAFFLITLAAMAVLVPLFLLFVPAAATTGAAGAIGSVLLLTILMMVGIAALSARLLPLVPAGVAEPLGPIALIGRSWSLTKGYFWQLFGTILLLGLIYSVMLGIIGMIIGLLVMMTIGSPMPTPFDPVPNPTAVFVNDLILSVIGCIVTIFMLSFFARIYAHLSGRTQEVGRVFE